MKKFLPWIIVGVFTAWILASLRPPQDKPGQLNLQEFGALPVISSGRFQPIDTLARNTLLQLRDKSTANLEPWSSHPKIISAAEWLLATALTPDVADTYPVFRVDHPELISLLKLPEKNLEQHSDGKSYSWNQIKPELEILRREAERSSGIESAHRTTYDQAVVRLWNAHQLYEQVQGMFGPAASGELTQSVSQYLDKVDLGRTAYQQMQSNKPYDAAALEWLSAQFGAPVILPGRTEDDWKRVAEYYVNSDSSVVPNFALTAYAKIAAAYRAGNVADFNQAVAEYHRTLVENKFVPQLTKAAREHYYNYYQPFYKAMVLYVAAFLLACGFWFNLADWLRKSAFGLIFVAFIIHTTGLLFRMWLEGRPPVTNLYSSAIFIGWGAVVLGMVLEWFWRNAIGLVIAAAIGFATLIIAHNLALGGDTMEMMRAVLDTNFWLATHVVVVTMGYASTFVAGFLAIIYVVLGLFTTRLSTRLEAQPTAVTANGKRQTAPLGDDFGKSLSRMVYAIVCFATLFSFVGTVLGGIWADQSWGRFWGWDPKENGALLIVLWNAAILHARWGGLVRDRGLMNMAIFGNIVTSFSWFGVNMLGIGLHSYGFMNAAFWWLIGFDISQAVLIILGLIPLEHWRSFRTAKPTPPEMPRSPRSREVPA